MLGSDVVRRATNKRVVTGMAVACFVAAILASTISSSTAVTPIGGSGADAYGLGGASTIEELYGTTDSSTLPVVNTGEKVTKSMCAPCHRTINKAGRPGLKFGHGLHVLIECNSCHDQMPHYEGRTDFVPMQTCFACHGVEHGVQGEMAAAGCNKCHTPAFSLRPKTHGTAWAGTQHAQASNTGAKLNDCMMCHNAITDCNGCHREVGAAELPNEYHSVITKPEMRNASIIVLSQTTRISQCQHCHDNLDATPTPGVIFAHEAHTRRNYSCTDCHAVFPHTDSETAKPLMIECYRCHGSNHNGQGEIASEDCYLCHPREGFDLVPENHTDSFIKKTHGPRAYDDVTYCRMCHKIEFCVPCHRATSRSVNAPVKQVIPKNHETADWMADHGSPYLKGEGLCGACHDGPSCTRCHKTVMPHPSDFVENHKPAEGVTRDDCTICHSDRNSCQECHHGGVKNAYLVEEACVGCHPEMKQKPAVDIKDKAFAEHAVHFDIAKTIGKPYKCYECHFTFGDSKGGASVSHGSKDTGNLQQGHDLQLCYTCHGALDPFSVQIAPWPGGSLCVRCHKNLNMF